MIKCIYFLVLKIIVEYLFFRFICFINSFIIFFFSVGIFMVKLKLINGCVSVEEVKCLLV